MTAGHWITFEDFSHGTEMQNEQLIETLESGLLPPHQVLIKPLITEKGTEQTESLNLYAFQVNMQANKFDVRRSVEEMFKVKVLSVAIQNRKGKPRRSRARMGHTAPWKKAVVKLAPDNKIELF